MFLILFLLTVVGWRLEILSVLTTQQEDPFKSVLAGVFLLLGFLVCFTLLRRAFLVRTPVVINEDGILDRRLRLGIIAWKDISSARLFTSYGSSLILLKVHNPDQYVPRLPIISRLMSKWYKSEEESDLFVDLTELDGRSEEVLKTVKSHL